MSIECVLPPPKFVCNLHYRVAATAQRGALPHYPGSCFRLSVRYVRLKELNRFLNPAVRFAHADLP